MTSRFLNSKNDDKRRDRKKFFKWQRKPKVSATGNVRKKKNSFVEKSKKKEQHFWNFEQIILTGFIK